MNNDDLREALELLTEHHPIIRQVELIPIINDEFGASIVIKASNHHELPQERKYNCRKYNCHRYSLNLVESEGYIDTIKSHDYAYHTDNAFMSYLIEKGVLIEKKPKEIKDDDIIIYFNKGIPVHSGRVTNGRIISKWGSGLLLEHDTYEVPANYGDSYIYYSNISEEKALEYFHKYVSMKTPK